MARQTAMNAGRRDADIWMQETPESEWPDAIKAGRLGADENLINSLGYAEAAKYLGISNPYRNGKLTDAASTAFEEYSRAWAKRVSDALRAQKVPTRNHATKKKTARQLEREIAHALAKPELIGVSPAGVEWVAYKPEHVGPMKARLAALHQKHSSPQVSLERARDHYEKLRARVFRAQGTRRKRGSDALSDDAYWALSDQLHAARKALRAAERKVKKKTTK